MTAATLDHEPSGGAEASPLAVVIPTRNRAGLAIGAARSLLAQRGVRLRVFVSDNSSSDEERRLLADFCRRSGDPRLTYLRPPASQAMGEHWDWAVTQALERSDAGHLLVHYDRRVTKPGHLALVARAAARHPGLLISYPQDSVVDDPPPAVLYQVPCTGKLYEMPTDRVLELTARGMIHEMGQAFPHLSNCLVPRRALERIRERFGSVCASTGPDSCFTYRFCALGDGRFLHLDRALGVVHASHRSNGAGYLRGRTDGDFGDFLKTWGDRPWLEAAPIPGMNLGQNMLYHEYELVRREVRDPRFPPIEMGGYLRELARGLSRVEDPRLRDAMRAALEDRGWREEPAPAEEPAAAIAPAAAPPVRRARRPFYKPFSLTGVLTTARDAARMKWTELKRSSGFTLFLADYLGIRPPHIHCYTFSSNEKAVRYAIAYPRRTEAENPYIVAMNPSEVEPV